jgi:hypothetical protein
MWTRDCIKEVCSQRHFVRQSLGDKSENLPKDSLHKTLEETRNAALSRCNRPSDVSENRPSPKRECAEIVTP